MPPLWPMMKVHRLFRCISARRPRLSATGAVSLPFSLPSRLRYPMNEPKFGNPLFKQNAVKIGAAVVVAGFALFVWPTPYHWQHVGHVVYRVNRFTGTSEQMIPVPVPTRPIDYTRIPRTTHYRGSTRELD